MKNKREKRRYVLDLTTTNNFMVEFFENRLRGLCRNINAMFKQTNVSVSIEEYGIAKELDIKENIWSTL